MRRTITERTSERLIRMAYECDALEERARAMQLRFVAAELDQAATHLRAAASKILIALDKGN